MALIPTVALGLLVIVVAWIIRLLLKGGDGYPFAPSDSSFLPMMLEYGANPGLFLAKARKTVGNVIRVSVFGAQEFIFVYDKPKFLKSALRMDQKISFHQTVESLVGHITCNPPLTPDRIYGDNAWDKRGHLACIKEGFGTAAQISVIFKLAKEEMDAFLERAPGKFDMGVQSSLVMLSISGRYILGDEFFTDMGISVCEWAELFREYELLGLSAPVMACQKMWPRCPFGANGRFLQVRDKLFKLIDAHLPKKFEKWLRDDGAEEQKNLRYNHFMFKHWKHGNDNPRPDDSVTPFNTLNLHSISMNLAFHVNMAGVMAWTLLHLFSPQNQAMKERIKRDILEAATQEDVVQRDVQDIAYDPEVLKRLHVLDWSITESIRMYSTNAITPRMVLEDTEVDGVKLTKGQFWLVGPANNHLEGLPCMDHLEKWDPYRWETKEARELLKGPFLPWGDGKHLCKGMNVARSVQKSIFCRFLFDPKLCLSQVDPSAPVPPPDYAKASGTLFPVVDDESCFSSLSKSFL